MKAAAPFLLLIAGGLITLLIFRGSPPEDLRAQLDSLARDNARLEAENARVLALADSVVQRSQEAVRRVRRLQGDANLANRRADSLEALVPDTATMIPRALHEEIVLAKDRSISALHDALHTATQMLEEQGRAMSDLRRQLVDVRQSYASLLSEHSTLLNRYRNPGLLKRAEYALPYVAGTLVICRLAKC